jgi:hypothetical protein
MISDLVLNPFAAVSLPDVAGEDITVTSPVPGRGLTTTRIALESDPGLYEIFADTETIPLSLLDIEKDLGAGQRQLLNSAGVLLDPSDLPRKPCFQCLLDNVEPLADIPDLADLIVNPTFEFQKVDLANFSSWLNEKHLSPYRPSAWITSPFSGVRLGHWLNEADAQTVEHLVAAHPPPNGVGHELSTKLYSAGILICPEEFEAEQVRIRGALNELHEQFRTDKYTVVAGLIPREQIKAMQDFYRSYVQNGFMPFGDAQVPGRYRQHNEPLASTLHKDLAGLMSAVVGTPVKCSYVYAASYVEGAVLEPHTDREQCEYSISFQVDYQPAGPDERSPWAIFLESETTVPAALYLSNGDGLFYKGRQLVHYRHALPAGHRSTSLFFHFVDADFDGTLT